MARLPGILLAADWGKESKKRAVYKADVSRRAIERVDGTTWSLERLLTSAREAVQAGKGPVIISLDLVLGAPEPYFRQAQRVDRWQGVRNFIDWLPLLSSNATFWQEVKKADEWSVQRPFFAVPKGKGALKAFYEKAGYDLRRRVDVRCRSKCPFIVSGIPGSVGSGTRCLWKELVPLAGNERDFKVWPFEGRMCELLENQEIIVAENYPGISYTSALSSSLPGAQILVSKTKSNCRSFAVELLEKAKWVADHSVQLPNLNPARESEDDFDALMTAAGELRCVLEGQELEDLDADDPVAEGGMLLTSVGDFDRKATRFGDGKAQQGVTGKSLARKAKSSERSYPCPIPKCDKVFKGTRGGWDGHVGGFSIHPDWHPDVTDPEQRRKLFKKEFPDFFQ